MKVVSNIIEKISEPSPLKEVNINQNAGSCVEVSWQNDEFSGADFYTIQYSLQSTPNNSTNVSHIKGFKKGKIYILTTKETRLKRDSNFFRKSKN